MRPHQLLPALALLALAACQDSGAPSGPNALINERSPYLLQHAHNPVNWQPWGPEALQRAEAEDKLLIVSIGYAACHWCHVMERESFMDSTVARIMNEHFVAVKVDREERPDVDNIYMTACQLAGEGSCGWPLNAFALPNGQPVWTGTYFPKEQWVEVLTYFAELYKTDKKKLTEYGNLLAEGIKTMDLPEFEERAEELPRSLSEASAQKIYGQSDRRKGGIKGAPKFPLPSVYEFLLYQHYLNGDTASLAVVEQTLAGMSGGGLYDQLGGGFARYATDADWRVPHFEKMMYDNAQLASLYSKAYQLTGEARYREVVEETLAFVQRELSSPEGGFYSSLDADSEGKEGLFYTWRAQDIDSLLTEQEAELFKAYYQVRPGGNWEGRNILLPVKDTEALRAARQLAPEALQALLESARSKLLQAREQRPRPGLDDKQLTAWNALMIIAYADAYQALQQPGYRAAALKAGQLLRNELLQKDYRLLRSYKDGQAYINGFLDDYAFTIQAFLKLYAITFDQQWLTDARGLTDYAVQHFGASESPLFYYTSSLDPLLIARQMPTEDNVIPSSNSAMARALLQLGTYQYDSSYLNRAHEMLAVLAPQIESSRAPAYFANWLLLYNELAYPHYEVAIVGPGFEEQRMAMQARYLPNALYLGGAEAGSLSLLEGKVRAGETFIYVCQDRVCQLPVQKAEQAVIQIKKGTAK